MICNYVTDICKYHVTICNIILTSSLKSQNKNKKKKKIIKVHYFQFLHYCSGRIF